MIRALVMPPIKLESPAFTLLVAALAVSCYKIQHVLDSLLILGQTSLYNMRGYISMISAGYNTNVVLMTIMMCCHTRMLWLRIYPDHTLLCFFLSQLRSRTASFIQEDRSKFYWSTQTCSRIPILLQKLWYCLLTDMIVLIIICTENSN